ncbi:hypothetical protein [Streptomyces albireticuli]|uniref:hypothetical protein n=1 Tax=Streptomyces albireticuli TaxID=1940 RepID=UPI001F19860B|nr:hypothetical protein [Streptomyces albireticuli]
MNHPSPRPHPKSCPSTTGNPSPAEPAAAPTSGGALKVVARQGVLSALRSDPHPHPPTVTGIRPGLRIRRMLSPVPVADWLCSCGHHEHARGKEAVAALAARARPGACPDHSTASAAPARRTAA